jgi:hypothetical protein
MSADNPTSTTADKPVPVTPAPAEANDGADAYDPDLDDLADEALSEPPIDYDRDSAPASAQGVGENQGSTPAASVSAEGQGGAGQDGAGVTGVPGARDQDGHQVSDSEGVGSLEQPGNAPGAVAADGGGDVYDPDLDALADEALSEPPIDYNEDPAPMRGPAAAPVHDSDGGHGTAGPGAGESGTEPPASERPGRGDGQQDSQPAPVRASQDGDTESRAEDDANGKPDSDPAAKADTPVPQPPAGDAGSPEASDQDPARPADAAEPVSVPSPAASEPQPVTERVPEPGSEERTAEAAAVPSQGDDVPAASPAGTSSETSEEPQTLPAERPEPPVASSAAEDTGSREPQAAEEDPAVGQAEEPAEPQASGKSPHLEGDEEEGSYGDVSWIALPEEGRTPGDTTPTGIQQMPTGEKLLDGEGKRRNKLDRMLDTLVERGDDVRDASSAMGAAIENDVHPVPNPTGHSGSQQPVGDSQYHWSGESDAIGSTVLIGVVFATAATHGIRRLIEHGKAHQS